MTLDDNKITQSSGNSAKIDIVAGYSETPWRSQKTALGARSVTESVSLCERMKN
jgi:hypothetical protein